MAHLTKPVSLGRRRMLQWLGASALGATHRGVPAQGAPDYKALVCIFLDGGNDGENTLIRYDATGYQTYAAIRTPASGLNIPQAELLPVQPARGGPPYGFHPACAPLKTLFEQKQLAVVANMGQLVRPSTKVALETQGAPRPANLFSHNDQQLAQQSADASGFTRVGWGGRVADKLDAYNAGTLFPALISTNNARVFCNGETSIPLLVGGGTFYGLSGSGATFQAGQFDALRLAALQEIAAHSRDNVYEMVGQLYAQQGLSSISVVAPIIGNPASIVPQHFAGASGNVAGLLQSVAKLIEGRAAIGLNRQVFFVSVGGYDTHGTQLGLQSMLLGDLARGLQAFQSALAALGMTNNVTTFTLSDFGRTLKPASDNGTDHGWGNYAFVVGGAVRGGDFYGTVPTMALNGPDDLGKEGRWIPTTSLEQYGATLCRWFGIAEGDLPYVFPNIGAFANSNLGFMA
jgi:uncharacterized protein (DUF1501 family)